MLEINDLRDTRVFQEGREEGREQERERLLQEKFEAIPKLAARGLTAAEIADVLQLDLPVVKDALRTSQR